MQTQTQIKALLAARGLRPRHALGQNFLVEKTLVAKLVDQAGVQPGDAVLEVGPGTGTLTEALLARGARVVACELDPGLAQLLRDRLAAGELPGAHAANLTIISGDALERGRRLNTDALAALGPPDERPFALVANLPYQAGTPIMLALLVDHPRCHTLAVTVQREVAQRLVAPPGGKDYGTLGIVAQAVADVKVIAELGPACFWPPPDVHSSMVLLRRRQTPLCTDPARLLLFCQAMFAKRRKQLGAILGRSLALPAGIDPQQRPETLRVEQFIELLNHPAGRALIAD